MVRSRGITDRTKCLCGDGEQARTCPPPRRVDEKKTEEAFNENGKLIDELAELAPRTASHGDNPRNGNLAERPEDA